MNRKLHRSTLALSASTAVLAMLLLAGGPATPPTAIMAADLSAATISTTGVDPSADVSQLKQRRHARRSRAALALPYFSFAQGLRRVTGS